MTAFSDAPLPAWPRRLRVLRAACGFCDGNGMRTIPLVTDRGVVWSPYRRIECRSCQGNGRIPLVVEHARGEGPEAPA